MKPLNPNIFIGMVLFTTVLSLCLYFFLTSGLQDKIKVASNNAAAVYKQRFWGVIVFGGTPVLVSLFSPVPFAHYFGLLLKQPVHSGIWLAVLSALIIPFCFFAGKVPANLKVYPQIRATSWNMRLLALSALSWAAYLFCYEIFFRGFLLFSCVRAFGPQWAVLVNVVVYALSHLPKGKNETIGSLLFGGVLCIATLQTESIWVAFGSHLVMALTMEWVSIYNHGSMRIVLKGSH